MRAFGPWLGAQALSCKNLLLLALTTKGPGGPLVVGLSSNANYL